jgi:hypothetical protein
MSERRCVSRLNESVLEGLLEDGNEASGLPASRVARDLAEVEPVKHDGSKAFDVALN